MSSIEAEWMGAEAARHSAIAAETALPSVRALHERAAKAWQTLAARAELGEQRRQAGKLVKAVTAESTVPKGPNT